ncbi:MAG TPA: hypothetical protein VFR90_13000 [Methylibium sp.]|nr:hypothetical protein [Methylibium sp.]HEU4460033.1 hypothetical protein [Methylibium sp.]
MAQQLSGLDAAFLDLEAAQMPMHVDPASIAPGPRERADGLRCRPFGCRL